jgi:bacterioferritin-associated ferredoxin
MTLEYCKTCRDFFEVTEETPAGYQCPKCSKPKGKRKMLDQESFNRLTKVLRSVKHEGTRHLESFRQVQDKEKRHDDE